MQIVSLFLLPALLPALAACTLQGPHHVAWESKEGAQLLHRTETGRVQTLEEHQKNYQAFPKAMHPLPGPSGSPTNADTATAMRPSPASPHTPSRSHHKLALHLSPSSPQRLKSVDHALAYQPKEGLTQSGHISIPSSSPTSSIDHHRDPPISVSSSSNVESLPTPRKPAALSALLARPRTKRVWTGCSDLNTAMVQATLDEMHDHLTEAVEREAVSVSLPDARSNPSLYSLLLRRRQAMKNSHLLSRPLLTNIERRCRAWKSGEVVG